eukprot:2359166-Prymnesium_polylepis.2
MIRRKLARVESLKECPIALGLRRAVEALSNIQRRRQRTHGEVAAAHDGVGRVLVNVASIDLVPAAAADHRGLPFQHEPDELAIRRLEDAAIELARPHHRRRTLSLGTLVKRHRLAGRRRARERGLEPHVVVTTTQAHVRKRVAQQHDVGVEEQD